MDGFGPTDHNIARFSKFRLRPSTLVSLTSEIDERALESDELKAATRLWQAARMRSGQAMPSRRDIDIVDFGRGIGNLVLLDVEDGGRDFRYRVFGSALARLCGADMQGWWVSELPNELRDLCFTIYRAAVRDKAPYLARATAARPDTVSHYIRLVLPLSEQGERVDALLVAIYPSNEAG